MKRDTEIPASDKAAGGTQDIIFKNKNKLSRNEEEQLNLFSDIIIDIFLQQIKVHEKKSQQS